MSGWVPPSSSTGTTEPSGAPVAWAAPDETPGLGTSELLRGAWHLYGSSPGGLLTVAVIPESLRAILTLPSLLLAVHGFRAMALVFSDMSRFRTNPEAFQAEIQAATRTSPELAIVAGLCGGLTFFVIAISWSALTAAALEMTAGRMFTAEAMFRAVAARRSGILVPAVVVGLVWAGLGLASGLFQPTSTGVPSASQTALLSLFGVLLFALTIAGFALAVYWSLGLPAILAEQLGLRDGLARGAHLTKGIRIRLGLAIFAASFLAAITVAVVAALIALVGGLAASSLDVAITGYLVVSLVGAFLWAPFIPCLLAVAYRDRIAQETTVTPPAPSDPTEPSPVATA